MVDPDAPEGRDAHEVDGDTIPRSRLRAAWGPPEAPAAPAPVAPDAPRPATVVRDAPEPARPAERRTGPDLEHRIAPWAVPSPAAPASTNPSPAPSAPSPAHAPQAPERAPRDGALSRSRARSHARFTPPRGAVDLAPERPTPLTDPPKRRFWPWRRSAG